jgi:RNA polymerase sigma-70 factor, ECF subfamily
MPIGSRFPQVLQAAVDGLEWAWAELYREYAPALLRFLRSQGAADPEDLLGDCFVQLLRNLADFSGDEAGFRAWTFTVARSRLIDSWRKAARHPVMPVADPSAEHGAARHVSGPADEGLLVDAGVAEILERLTPEQRAVITLRFVDRFSLAETAEILQRSEGSVKLLQHRAIRTLRRELG